MGRNKKARIQMCTWVLATGLGVLVGTFLCGCTSARMVVEKLQWMRRPSHPVAEDVRWQDRWVQLWVEAVVKLDSPIDFRDHRVWAELLGHDMRPYLVTKVSGVDNRDTPDGWRYSMVFRGDGGEGWVLAWPEEGAALRIIHTDKTIIFSEWSLTNTVVFSVEDLRRAEIAGR